MKLLQRRIQQAARDSRVQQLIVERDYAQSYVLFGIANQAALRETLVFKGGTALKKIHFKTYRFSEDLDFSAIDGPKGTVLERAIRAAIDTAQSTARAFAPVTMVVERYEERAPHPGGQETFIVRIQFPWQQQPLVPVKIEITHDEPVLLPAPLMPVVHGYGETFEAMVRTYRLEEVCAEKLRSTRQTQAKRAARGWARPRGRDFYDLWHLVRLDAEAMNWAHVAEVLPRKCSHRAVAISSIDDIFDSALVDEVRATWARTLAPFVPDLPDVDRVLVETRERLEALLQL